jgi:hypothetical protein
MKRVFLILWFCFFSSLCFGQRIRFYVQDEPFQFMTPDGWHNVPRPKLPSEHLEALEEVFGETILAVSKLTDADYFISPYIITQLETTGTTSEHEIENLIKTGEGRDKALEKLEEGAAILTWVGEGAELAEADIEYDEEKHAIITTMELDYSGVGNILVISVEMLGSYRKTTLHFYADGPDTKHMSDLVAEILDTFSYEFGYGFGGGMGTPEESTVKKGLKFFSFFNMLLGGIYGLILVVCLWLGLDYWEAELRFPLLLLIAFVGGMCNTIPIAGFPLAALVMWGLISKFSSAEVWPDSFLVVIIAQALEGLIHMIIITQVVPKLGFI